MKAIKILTGLCFVLTNKLLIIGTFMMLILSTCSKDPIQDQVLADEEFLKAAHGQVFTVYPSGGDDTQALIDAFNLAKSKGHGSVVQLSPGLFTIGFIEIRDFYGHLRGSGKSRTKITNLENLPCGPVWENNKVPALMKFIGGDVNLSNFTVNIKDGRPCAFSEINELYMGDLFSVIIMADYTDNYVPDPRTIRATVENIDIFGGKDDGYGVWATEHNTGIGIWFGPDFVFPLWDEPFGNGSYLIKGCQFSFFLDGVEGFGLGHEATMTVTNNWFDKSVMQLYFTANNGAKFVITNNRFTNGTLVDCVLEDAWTDLVFPTVSPDYQTEFYVSGNYFDSPEGVNSLLMNDIMRVQTLNEDFAMLYSVKNNTFKTRESGMAIRSESNIGARIFNNKFIGNGDVGILVNGNDAAGIWAKNIQIANNNFQHSDYDNYMVHLGPMTTDCKVAGIASDNVLDEGVNNVITGTKAHKFGSHSYKLPSESFKGRELMMKGRQEKSY